MIIVCQFLFTPTVLAYSTFFTTCTTPASATNYVSSPDTRGTLDILWGCLFTVIACTWTIQHLNVPEQRNRRDDNWHGDLKWMLKGFWRNLKWMLAIMIAPEYILGKACADLVAAVIARNEMREFAREDGVEWGLGHCFFANMGGFVLAARGQARPPGSSSAKDRVGLEAQPSINIQTEVPNVEDQMPISALEPNAEDATEAIQVVPEQKLEDKRPGSLRRREVAVAPRSSGEIYPTMSNSAHAWASEHLKYSNPYHLLADDIVWLREWGVLPRLPDISSSELHDKSKGDVVIKVIAIFQIFWFILHIIIRASNGLGISQLEIAVTAFSVCGIITYLLIIQKPKNVQTPIVLINYDGGIPIDGLYGLYNQHLQGYLRGLFAPSEDIVNRVEIMGAPIPNDALKSHQFPIRVLHFGVATGGVIFGSIHVAAWDFDFPTTVERDIWRVASIASTVLMPVMYSALFYNEFVAGFKSRLFLKSWNIVFGSLYLLVRVVLLVEVFRTLFYLPPSAYVATWVSSIPHVH